MDIVVFNEFSFRLKCVFIRCHSHFLEFAAPVSVYMSRTEFAVMREHISQFNSMTLEGILENIWTTVGVCSTEEVRHAGCSAHEAAGAFFLVSTNVIRAHH